MFTTNNNHINIQSHDKKIGQSKILKRGDHREVEASIVRAQPSLTSSAPSSVSAPISAEHVPPPFVVVAAV